MCEQFSRELLKVVVGQICEGFGFTSIQRSACEVLTDILQKYIEEVGFNSCRYAQHSCRTDSNYFDVKLALHDLGVSIQDLMNFAAQADEIPFAKAVPSYPIRKKVGIISELREEPDPFPSHIPSYLPPYPPKHTYIKTPVYELRNTDAQQIRKTKSKDKRKLEDSLRRLTEKFEKKKPFINYDSYHALSIDEDDQDSTIIATSSPSLFNNEKNNDNINNEIMEDSKEQNQEESIKRKRMRNIKTEEKISNPFLQEPVPFGQSDHYPQATPLQPNYVVNHIAARTLQNSLIEEDTIPRMPITSNDLMEDSERAKKRQKCDKILSLEHSLGVDLLEPGDKVDDDPTTPSRFDREQQDD